MKLLIDLAAQIAARFEAFGPDDAGQFTRDILEKYKETGELETELDAIPDDHFATLTATISRQTDTHMKWFVYRSVEEVDIWVHQFRTDEEIKKTDRYAASVHSHRYGFASLLLNGGYTADYHDVVPHEGEMSHGAPVEDKIIETQTYRAGDAYFMQHNKFHRLRDFVRDTVSFVIQLPPEAISSFSVDRETQTLVEHINFGNDRNRMRQPYRQPLGPVL